MAITVDVQTISSSTSPADPTTFSHTVTAGTTFLLLLIGYRAGDKSAETVTYGGDAMTHAVTGFGSTAGASIFYKTNPKTGANTVSIGGGGSTLSACAVSLDGVKISDPIDAIVSDGGNDDPSVDITPIADNCWLIDALGVRSAGSGFFTQGTETGRTDWTTDWEYEPGGNEGMMGGTKYEDVSPAAQKTFSYTVTNEVSGHIGLAIVSIEPAAVVSGRIMSSLAGRGGLAGYGGIAGYGGGLAG